jgi:hypothetical protein
MEASMAWQRRQREIAEARATGKAPPAPKLTMEQMQAMIDKVKEKK